MGQCLGSGAEVLLGLAEVGLGWADGSWDEPGSSRAGDYLGSPISFVPLCVCVCIQASFQESRAGCRTWTTPGLLGQDKALHEEVQFLCFCLDQVN